MDIKQLRSAIPALRQAIYLNSGTFGPSPTVVLDEIRAALDLIETHGAYAPVVRRTIEREAYEKTRLAAAELLGAEADEVILTRSNSDGINIIAHGLDWQPGDEVVITDEEHASGIVPWLILAERKGIKVRTVALTHNPELLLQRLDEQVSPRTRLVFVSHVTHLSGLRLPVRRICRLAHDRGTLAVVDGAHALGQFAVDVRDIGCDAYMGCGHKWMLGPQGTSMAYIACDHLETFKPSWIGWGAHAEFKFDPADPHLPIHNSAKRFEFGTKQWPLFPGLERAIRFIADITPTAIESRVQPLATQLKRSIDDVPHLRRLTPMAPEQSSGIVSMAVAADTPDDIKDQLWHRHNLIVAYAIPYQYLRLSVAFFTTRSEIELAVAAIAELTA